MYNDKGHVGFASLYLVSLGFCSLRLGIPSWVGRVLSLQKIGEKFGRRVPCASFGWFGRLKTVLYLGMRFCLYKY